MSAIATNNLAADGAGFSASNQNFIELACQVNHKQNGSDGPATAADGSAVVAFQTRDELDGHYRLYMSYYSGSAFSPPVEVTGVDRDEYANANTPSTNSTPDITTSNILMIPLNTSGYKGSSNGTDQGSVRANSGNWVIVWDATTFTTAPNATGSSSVTGAGGSLSNNVSGNNGNTAPNSSAQRIAQNLKGAHRALYETVFVKSFVNTPSKFSQVLGTNGTTTTGAPSREYRYGFLVTAPQITVLQRGQETGFSSRQLNGTPTVTGNSDIISPAESVQSYGFASDGIAHCANYGSSGAPFSNGGRLGAGNNPNSVTNGTPFQFVEQPHALVTDSGAVFNNGLQATPFSGTPGGAAYAVGEDVTFVQLFFTQIVSSANGQAFTPITSGSSDVGVHGGQRLAMFNTGLDLRTMAFGTPTEVTTTSTEPAQPLKAALAPIPSFKTYNQFVFLNFVDASLATSAGFGLGGLSGPSNGELSNGLDVREFNLALVALTVVDQGNGQSTLGTAPLRISVQPTSTLKTDADDSVNFGNNFNTETFGNQDQAWLPGGCCVFGSDEGLGDTTVFFLEQHSSVLSNDQNVDLELAAVVLKGDGTLQTSASGKNPILLSESVGEAPANINDNFQSNPVAAFGNFGGGSNAALPTGFILHDPVEGVQCCMNRDGTYVVVTYRQFEGTSSGNFNKALNAIVMKTFRVVNSGTGSNGTGNTSGAPAVETRFAAGSVPTTNTGTQGTNFEIRIDDPNGGTALSQPNVQGNQSVTGPNGRNFPFVINNGFLNSFSQDTDAQSSRTNVQGQFMAPCGYRCSLQSDRTKINAVWFQGDSSEARVFVRQLKIDTTNATPTVTLGSIGELEAGNLVTGDAVLTMTSAGLVQQSQISVPGQTQFHFLPKDLKAAPLAAVDLGVDAAKNGGGLLFVYSKTTDATTTDGNFFNRNVIAAQWDGTTVSNRTVIDRGVFENAEATQPTGNSNNTFPGFLGPQTLPAVTNGAITNNSQQTTLKTNLLNVVQVPQNSAIESAPSASPASTYIYFVTENGDNANSPAGLYTRKFDHTLRAKTGNAAAFGDQFVPTAGTGPGSATFQQPTRLDHNTGGDVTGLQSTNTDSTTAFVTFFQDGHLWGSGTTDGVTYTNDGKGSPDPFLIDNDTSASTTAANVTPYPDGKCNTLHKSILFMAKNDLSQTNPQASRQPSGGNNQNNSRPSSGYALRLRVRTFN